MTVGIHLVNANSQVTFSDDKTYYNFKKKFVGSDAMTPIPDTALLFDTGYNGTHPPIFFVNLNDYYGLRFLSRDNESGGNLGNWIISLWTDNNSANTAPTDFEMYMFLPYSETTQINPAWGIQIRNSDDTIAYNSDMKILNVGGFETITPPSANPSCSDSSQFSHYHSGSTAVTDYGFTKPCFMIIESGLYIRDCLPNNDRIYISLMKYTHSSLAIYQTWYNTSPSGFNIINNMTVNVQPSNSLVGVIDGADYD